LICSFAKAARYVIHTMMSFIPTVERWRSRLPHWEVSGHWHFVTIRCHGTLPAAVKLRLNEIHQTLQTIEAQTDAFHELQRRYFLTTEKYLDTGTGFAPFKEAYACEQCLGALAVIETEGWLVGEATIMPNHIHLLMIRQNSVFSLKEILMRFKGRSARRINSKLRRRGRFWQEDWFDRWMRHDGERMKTVAYIRNNPVKAGLAKDWADYHWRISTDWNA